MPRKGEYTAADAARNGLVPAAPVKRVMDKWAAEHWWLDDPVNNPKGDRMVDAGSTRVIAEATGLHQDTIGKVRSGRKDWLEFDNADRIVTFIDPFLWRNDPELAAIYQGFDFSHLDVARPTSREADPLWLVDGLSIRSAAALLSVGESTIQRRRVERGFSSRGRVAA